MGPVNGVSGGTVIDGFLPISHHQRGEEGESQSSLPRGQKDIKFMPIIRRLVCHHHDRRLSIEP